ncbi:hypothetical protein [Embleya sp. NPDC005575]|uniref:hypothetical protein n=1 Tax=Embleya sp. NPDC005575 TaxID=3156892 RepID=UPI0033AA4F9D
MALGVVGDVGWDLRGTFAHHHLDGHFPTRVHSCGHHTDPLLFRHVCRESDVDPAETRIGGWAPCCAWPGSVPTADAGRLPYGPTPRQPLDRPADRPRPAEACGGGVAYR